MAHKSYPEKVITSLQNPKVKNSILLRKARERKKQKLFLVEGRKEVTRAIQAGYHFKRIFICQEIFHGDIRDLPFQPSAMPEVDEVSPGVYAHMTYRGDSEGILGWAVLRKHVLDQVRLSENPLILVVDAVEKPGNLGAILRTADAAGVDALIISDIKTDIYNPNVVRSSLGAVFSTQIGVGTAQEVIGWLEKNKIRIFCTALTASRPYIEINYKDPSAIVMGTETSGLSESWLKRSDQNIIIPMNGIVDSMNVSVSAGIVLFEALRQRRDESWDLK
jgi:TrmH family RNA methyltransferase